MKKFLLILAGMATVFWLLPSAAAETTNSVAAAPLIAPSLPEVGPSLLRVFGALVFVIGIFLGGVWLFRNWQRFAMQRGRVPKLNIVETRSLGGRQALYVVGYEQGRYLVATSAAGVSLLTHLPDAELAAPKAQPDGATPAIAGAVPSFSGMLAQILKGKQK